MTIGRVRFHRNGVAGEGFTTVQFTVREGRSSRHLVGIVSDGLVAVIDPADPSEPLRGHDLWGAELVHAAEVASLTGEAHL